MDKDEIKGKMKDLGGRAQRQAGEWTGNEENQAEGAEKQAEGKVQQTWGKVKDAASKAEQEARARIEKARAEQAEKDKKDNAA